MITAPESASTPPEEGIVPTKLEKQLARWFLETAGFPDEELRKELEVLKLTDADLAKLEE